MGMAGLQPSPVFIKFKCTGARRSAVFELQRSNHERSIATDDEKAGS